MVQKFRNYHTQERAPSEHVSGAENSPAVVAAKEAEIARLAALAEAAGCCGKCQHAARSASRQDYWRVPYNLTIRWPDGRAVSGVVRNGFVLSAASSSATKCAPMR